MGSKIMGRLFLVHVFAHFVQITLTVVIFNNSGNVCLKVTDAGAVSLTSLRFKPLFYIIKETYFHRKEHHD